MKPEWFPDWSGSIAAVVASGESTADVDIPSLRDRCRVIVVNNGFELAPWADALFAADGRWWDHYPLAKGFGGLKITSTAAAARAHKVIFVEALPTAHRFVFEPLGTIGHCGNSGFQAINLAVQFGARKILLIGFDFKGNHWHGDHVMPLRNPRQAAMDKWRDRLDAEAPTLAARGIEAVNCSPVSALQAFERSSVQKALDRWNEVAYPQTTGSCSSRSLDTSTLKLLGPPAYSTPPASNG